MTGDITGGCSCGAVRYSITAGKLNSGICHCTDCQRSSGAPFVVWVGVEPARFTLLQGTITEFASSEWARRGFCAACGSTLTYRLADDDGEINIAGGSLDAPDAAPPAFQIFPKDRPAFMNGFDDHLPVKDVEAYFNGLRER